MTNPNPLKEAVGRAVRDICEVPYRSKSGVRAVLKDLLIAVREILPEEKRFDQAALAMGTIEYDARLIEVGFNTARAEMEKTLSEYIEGSL